MRLFVAVNLPPAERESAYAAASPLRAAGLPVNWVQPAALHITIKFLGEVDDARAADLGPALSRAVGPLKPFDLGLGGFGAFPDVHHARVVWCGVEIHPALELLANDVERALQPFGFTSELEPFRPHVTLGRTKKDAPGKAMAKLPYLLARLDYASVVPVESVDLMLSRTAKDGAHYSLRHAAALGAGAGAA